MSKLLDEYNQRDEMYRVGVVITHPDEGGEVFENRTYPDAESGEEAVKMCHADYKTDEWDVIRLRYVNQVFTPDDK